MWGILTVSFLKWWVLCQEAELNLMFLSLVFSHPATVMHFKDLGSISIAEGIHQTLNFYFIFLLWISLINIIFCVLLWYNVTFWFIYTLDNYQLRVISISVTSNLYHFFRLSTLKIPFTSSLERLSALLLIVFTLLCHRTQTTPYIMLHSV